MISKLTQSGNITYGFMEFVVDSFDDLANITDKAIMGSTAFCINNKKMYILDGAKTWQDMSATGTGGAGTGTGGTVSQADIENAIRNYFINNPDEITT